MIRTALVGLLGIVIGIAHVNHVCAQDSDEPVQSPWLLTRNDDDLSISLVTFGRGGEIHQYFGHNALLVEDRARQIGVLYNFGMFSFGPDMLLKYLHGQLEFWAAATPVDATFRHYIAENRSIRVSDLNLSPAKRRFLAQRLAYYVLPEHREYRYHHYNNNCSTKLRDLLNATLDGQLQRAYQGTARLTYRGHTRRYTQQDPIVHMALLLWMNDSMERPIRQYDEAYLPDELERMVAHMNYVDADGKTVPLLKNAYTVFDAMRPPVPEWPEPGWQPLLAAGLVAGALALLLSHLMRRGQRWARVLLGLHHMVVGAVIGLLGLVAFLGLFTEWDVTKYNENLFLANPLTFCAFLLSLGFMLGSRRAQRWMGGIWLLLGASTLALLVLKALPAFDQDTHLPMCLLAPLNLGCALAHLQLSRWRRRTTQVIALQATA